MAMKRQFWKNDCLAIDWAAETVEKDADK